MTGTFFRSRWVNPPDGVEELDAAQLAPGFRAAGVAAGLKPSGAPDVGLVVSDAPEISSAMLLTASATAAAPVRLCRESCDAAGVRAVIVNAGNANAATGEEGKRNAAAMQSRAASLLELDPAAVAVASTGIIGEQLPMDRIEAGIDSAAAALAPNAGRAFAEAIITTDNGPKLCTVSAEGVTVSAQAKGAGMTQPTYATAPHATTLAFVQTDAVVPDAGQTLRSASAGSLERITVDGQMSTNDAIFLQATGTSGREMPAGLLGAVLLQLAVDIAADGEGATRVARLSLEGAATDDEAERTARAIANSPLVKTALFGRDPNWGRIVQAAGMALAGEDVELGAGDIDAGEWAGEEAEVELAVRLGRGACNATVFFSDLTYDYVRINAEYTT